MSKKKVKCPYEALIKSAYANETARAKGSQTGSTNKQLAEEREKFFLARRDTIDITVDFLQNMFMEQDGSCPVSDIVIDMNDKHIKDKSDWRWMLAPSLDRLDNTLGYTKENVQIVTRFVNVGFKDFSGDRELIANILFRGHPRPANGLECLV